MKLIAVLLGVFLVGCASVRQQDLDAWVDMPVEALDTHPLFLTLPMQKTLTSSGVEVRNYRNGTSFTNCFSQNPARKKNTNSATPNFMTCGTNEVACNNIFYIKGGKVLEYAPTGQCMTDESVRPQPGFDRFQKKLP